MLSHQITVQVVTLGAINPWSQGILKTRRSPEGERDNRECEMQTNSSLENLPQKQKRRVLPSSFTSDLLFFSNFRWEKYKHNFFLSPLVLFFVVHNVNLRWEITLKNSLKGKRWKLSSHNTVKREVLLQPQKGNSTIVSLEPFLPLSLFVTIH